LVWRGFSSTPYGEEKKQLRYVLKARSKYAIRLLGREQINKKNIKKTGVTLGQKLGKVE